MGGIEDIAKAIARVCEPSPQLLGWLRSARFRGRSRIVSQLGRGALPCEATTLCDGIRYALDLDDDVQRAIYFDCYEQNDLPWMLAPVPAGGVCLDVGANVGFYTLHFARRVGPGGVVHAFEPDPHNAARLEANCRLNDFGSVVRIHRQAVGGAAGRLTFHRSDRAHSGWGSLEPFREAVEKIEVECVTLDAFLAAEGIRHVDLMKVDVEGAECDLLDGARESLAAHVFRHLAIEFNGVRLAARGLTFADFRARLEAAGYRPAPATHELFRRLTDGTLDPATRWDNLLFESPEAG